MLETISHLGLCCPSSTQTLTTLLDSGPIILSIRRGTREVDAMRDWPGTSSGPGSGARCVCFRWRLLSGLYMENNISVQYIFVAMVRWWIHILMACWRGAFYVLSPQAATHDEAVNVANLQLLASKFLNSHECCRNGPLSLFSVFCRLFMLR